MNNKFTIGRRAKVYENIPHNYQIIDLNSYKPNRPIVLILGGNGSTDDRAANGNAKLIESMLGVFGDDVDLLSVNYNQPVSLVEPFITLNCKELVEKLFIQYISDNGKRLDIETACKNMRNVTIFAHCVGVSGPMKRIVSLLYNKLIDLNYNTTEREQILSQIVMVAYASQHNDIIEEIKGIYCLSFSDEMFCDGVTQLSKQLLTKLDIINMVKTDRELLQHIDTTKPIKYVHEQLIDFLKLHRRVYNLNEGNNIRLFAYGLHQSEGHIWEMDHTFLGLEREYDWSKHRYASSTGDCVSRSLACALCNSIANSLINNKSSHFVEFDIKTLHNQINNICKQHNFEQTKLDNIDLEL